MKVLISSEVPSLGEDLNIDAIRHELNDYIQTIIPRINLQDLAEWNLLINITLRSTSGIGVFKRIKRYPSDTEFEISISIPVPNEKQASYGTAKVNDAFFLALDAPKFHTLEPNFENYETLSQYLCISSKSAIDLAFTHGFTCNGKKLNFKNKG